VNGHRFLSNEVLSGRRARRAGNAWRLTRCRSGSSSWSRCPAVRAASWFGPAY